DSGHAIRHGFNAHHFGHIFAAHGGRTLRVRHSHEKSHPKFIAGFAGLEIDPRARNAHGAAEIFEVLFLRVRRANTHQLGNLAAPSAATFCRGRAAWRVAVLWSLAHEFL